MKHSDNIQMQGSAVFNKLNSTDNDTDTDNEEIKDFSFNHSKLGIVERRQSGLSAGGTAVGIIVTILFTVLVGMSVANYVTIVKNSGDDACQNSEDGLDPLSFQQYEVSAWNGTVATDVYECSRVGGNVLFEGGNAVDAAIAAAFCLGVLSPASSGIGGGCMMVHYDAFSDSAVFMDSREVAPLGSTEDMFVDVNNTGLKPSLNGGLAVGVLAEVKGLHWAFEQYSSGNIPWSRLVAPAVELAKSWVINENVGASILSIEEHLFSGEYPELAALYLKHGGTQVKVKGDTVEQPLLSQTLSYIGQYGADYIYKNMSAAIAADIQAAGGIVTQADIEAYEPRLHTPVSADVLGYRYYGASGASSGGATVAGILAFMDSHLKPLAGLPRAAYDHLYAEAASHAFAIRAHLGDPAFVPSAAAAVQCLLNNCSCAGTDCVQYMDHLQADVTLFDEVLPTLYAYGGALYNLSGYNYESNDTDSGTTTRRRALREEPAEKRARTARRLLPFYLPTDHGTTHLSVVDNDGNAVALTSTVNTYFGSKVVSKSTGIVLNNQMDDFSVPGASNYFGLIASPYNYPQPGKRPLSSMSPSVLVHKTREVVIDGVTYEQGGSRRTRKVRLVGGGSGGPRIISATAQVILNAITLGKGVLSSVIQPKIHHQLVPYKIYAEHEDRNVVLATKTNLPSDAVFTLLNVTTYDPSVSGARDRMEAINFGTQVVVGVNVPSDLVNSLRDEYGHNVSHTSGCGVTQFIGVSAYDGEMTAVSDFRKGGIPVGVNF